MAVRAGRGARLRRAAGRSPLALVTALYTLAAVVATWPGVRSFGTAFIADGGEGHGEAAAGDHLQAVFRFWLVGHQLGRGDAPWVDPYSFQPLVEPETVLGGWPFGLAFWPLEAAFGPVVGWNALLLAVTVAAGLLTYGWLRSLSLPIAAAATGGLAFAVAPYRLAQSGGHLLGWVALFLPLALLAIERSRAASGRRAAHAWGALAALAVVSVPLSGQLHLALGAVPLVLAYALLRFERIAAAWTAAGLLGAVGVGLAVRYTLIEGSADGSGRSLQEVGEFSAEWLDLVSRWRLGGLEDFAYLGWLTPLLAVAGAVLLWREGNRALAGLLATAAVVPALLALGTNTPLYSALWHALPPFRFPRVPGRLLPIADLALAALAAVAVARAVLALPSSRARPAAVGLFLLVALDLTVLPFDSAVADVDNKAYRALRTAAPGRVLELPLFEPGVHFGSSYDYYALQAPRERPGGYSTLAPRPAFDFFFERNRLSCGVWLPGDEQTLTQLGIEHVTFHRGLYAQGKVPGAWFGWNGLTEHGFAPRTAAGAVTLFGRGSEARPPPMPEPPRSRPVLCEGWRNRVMAERQAPLWVYGSGELSLTVRAPVATTARLWVDGSLEESFPVATRAEVRTPLSGTGWHALVLEVPRLLGGNPPRGLRLVALAGPGPG